MVGNLRVLPRHISRKREQKRAWVILRTLVALRALKTSEKSTLLAFFW